jgi:transposase InsO family protein
MLVELVLIDHWRVMEVASAYGISQRTVYKWLARYRAEGVAGLQDRSSVAHRRRHALAPVWIALVRALRQTKLVAAQIAQRVPIARSTVSAILARLGWGQLRHLQPVAPIHRYEWQQPGELVHLDIKKLGRFSRPGHRVTGARDREHAGGGWEYAHVAVDDCTRFSYVEVLPDEKRYTVTGFWLRALREFRRHGIRVQRVLTDNGGAYCSRPFRKTCRWLGIVTKRTRPHRPQTNGKAERFIQTLQRQWAYGVPYANSNHRRAALPLWLRFYNEQRPHAALNRQTPAQRLAQFPEQRS